MEELEQKGFEGKQDFEYFNNMKHYKPLFYSGKGTPVFFLNAEWQNSLMCAGCIDIVLLVAFIIFIVKAERNEINFDEQNIPKFWLLFFTFSVVIMSHVFLILTQFLNPGIVNPDSISEREPQEKQKKFCGLCRAYIRRDMVHCKQCEVCVWGLDHHCGFFNKCIGGYQKWAFYLCILFAFLVFVDLFILIGFALL